MMFYKILIFVASGSMYSQYYQLEDIECPRWVPGTEQILPAGVTLSPAQELQNIVRCYCEVVKQEESQCLSRQIPKSVCLERTSEWIEKNLSLHQRRYNNVNGVTPPPKYDRMMNIEP